MIGIMLDVVSIVLNLIIIILLTKWLKKIIDNPATV